jgi:quinol monooxygenase YgiN
VRGVITYTVAVRAQPGKRDELLEVFRELAASADAEPGTLLYTFHTVDDDPDVVLTFEVFRDDDALKAHQRADVLTSVGPKLGPLIASSEMTRGAPAFGKGLPTG